MTVVQDRIERTERLNQALKESFEKMLQTKLRLGHSVVTVDADGRPITLTPDEAWALHQSGQSPAN